MSVSCHFRLYGEVAGSIWVVPFGAKFGQFLLLSVLPLLPLRQRNGGGMAADERVAYGTDRASGEPPRVQVQAGGLLPHFAQLTDEESLCAQTGGALDDRACDSQTELPCAQAQADALTRLGQPCAARSPMPLMCTSFEPGCLSQAIESIDDEDARRIARAEALYFTADPDGACCESEPYLTSSNPALRMSACFICA